MSLTDKITRKGNITAVNVSEAVKELEEAFDEINFGCGCCSDGEGRLKFRKKVKEIFGEKLT